MIEQVQEIEIVNADAFAIQARAEIDTQIATAHKFRRDVALCRKEAFELATCDIDTAISCGYKLPRGGKIIEGPSVRLAEIMAYSWENSRCQARVLEVGEKTVTCQAVFHDLQKNVAVSVEVKRRITKKDGTRYDDDMINVASMAGMAIARRNAIFNVIPKAYVNQVYDAAKKVAIGDMITLKERREKLMKAFLENWQLSKADILKHLELTDVDNIGLNELEHMAGIYTSLKDGMITPDQFKEVNRYGELHSEKSTEPEQKSRSDGARAAAKSAASEGTPKRGRPAKQSQKVTPEPAKEPEKVTPRGDKLETLFEEPTFEPEKQPEAIVFPKAIDRDTGEEYYDLDAMNIDTVIALVEHEGLAKEIPTYMHMNGDKLRRAVLGAINARANLQEFAEDDLPWEPGASE